MMKNFLSIGLKRIARKNFNPSKNARICSLYFKTEDFVFDSADQQNRRKRKMIGNQVCGQELVTSDGSGEVSEATASYSFNVTTKISGTTESSYN